jgi:dihydroorotate dehydrogenase
VYTLAKKILFRLSAERAHHLTTQLLNFSQAIPGLSHLINKSYFFEHKELESTLFGLSFKNPVGLAAGFDKDGKYLASMAQLGFGFLEVGTVTPKAQIGNPKPRLFRLPEDHAIINRMGFNNDGVDALVSRIKKLEQRNFILGGNIGKNKVTPNEEAYKDYLICFEKLFPWVDYFVVNVSSPNTPNLRQLQEKGPLMHLLSTLQEANLKNSEQKPILLKIAPDLTEGQLIEIVEIVNESQLAGIIATNTTISRDNLSTKKEQVQTIGAGGLSGRPLNERSTEVIRYIRKISDIPIIGVGGIMNPTDAMAKMDAGASLIQLYSGLIYAGPSLISGIKKEMVKRHI